MTALYDVAALGNAIVDVIAPATDAFLTEEGLAKGSMMLIDDAQSERLYGKMGAGVEASGGSAANTAAGVASFGGKAAYIGTVADDTLGKVFAHDIQAVGVHFEGGTVHGGHVGTGRSLINVTPDGQRTMCTYLGAANRIAPQHVKPELIEAAAIVYLEGYLFEPDEARAAFVKAAGLSRAAGRMTALTLSDAFVVDRHRQGLLAFIDSEVDLLFANEAELTALYECGWDEAVAALRGKVRLAAVTRGESGSAIIAGDAVHHVAAERIEKVVDTTGAGDQYAAGFMFGLAHGRPLPECGRLGSIAAAEVISHYGPRPLVSLKELAAKAGL